MQNEQHLTITYHTYGNIDALPLNWQTLAQATIEAGNMAYAPYSGFKVGAAVLLSNGIIVKGNNQENAAYPSGLCAERVALFSANANYPDAHVEAIAICVVKNNQITPLPVSPCGSCRQVMLETEYRYGTPIKIILLGANQINVLQSAHDLLPLCFTPKELI